LKKNICHFSKNILEHFAYEIGNERVSEMLSNALRKRHPYRVFKDKINELGISQLYYDYRSQAYLDKAEEWCRENSVAYRRKGIADKMLNILEVNDFSAPELDIYARRTEAQLLNKDNPEAGLFIAESPKVIGRALDAGYIPVSALVEKHQMKENEETRQILERFEGTDVPIFTAEFEVLTKMTGFKLTRGMLCALKRQPLMDYQDMCAGKDRIVILENVMNPTNVGAIFRSAAALNMDAVFLTPGCSDPLYRRASRVSMGTVFQIPWTFIQDNNEMRCQREILWPRQAITEFREMGYKTAALALTDDSVGIDNPELMQEEKLAIILGTEGEGLMDRTIEMCDYTVKIPMSHDVDSLNVAAASAVAFWQLGKKQK
jgi:tRNA G18 (ribose-2'-O)-methylase SpoU